METPQLIATCWTTSGTARPLDASEVASFSPFERIGAVAAGGWAGLGFAHEDLSAMRAGPGFSAVARAARDAGLQHVEVELITDWWLGEEVWRDRWDMLLEAAEVFGSPFIKAGTASADPWSDLSSLVEPLRRLAIEAGRRGVRVALEPLPFSMVGSVPAGADLVRAVDHPAAGLAVDYWHVFRAGTSLETLLSSLTPEVIAAVELDDADAEPLGTLFEDTRDRRRYCGEGAQDVAGFIRTLDVLGYRGPWGVEILSEEHRGKGLTEGLERGPFEHPALLRAGAGVKRYRIAALPGDGIGGEVLPAGQRVLDAVAARHGFSMNWEEQPWGSEHFRRHGRMMPLDALDTLRSVDAIYLGAVGSPDIDDVETLWGMLIPLRREFDQYVNLRPIRTLPGVQAPLRRATGIDLVVVRENTEGEYSDVGGRSYRGTEHEAAYQQAVFTRRGVARVARYAATLAGSRGGKVVSATKSNGIIHTMPFWDEVVREVVEEFPDVSLESVLVDALAARLVMRPQSLDVIVASNLFGDILSDVAAAIVGSIGIAPSANLDPERRHPSLFEPVHGSAPDIAGQGVANPVGAIWAGAMMLEHLGEPRAAADVVEAFTAALGAGLSTPDLGGSETTGSFTTAVLARLGS